MRGKRHDLSYALLTLAKRKKPNMANHVSTRVTFVKISEAGMAKLKEFYSRLKILEDSTAQFSDIFGDTSEEVDTYDWQIEHVGPKWSSIEEWDEESFTVLSAWDWPDKGVMWLCNQLGKVDPGLVVSVEYVDEMPNFLGWAIIIGYCGTVYEKRLDDDEVDIDDECIDMMEDEFNGALERTHKFLDPKITQLDLYDIEVEEGRIIEDSTVAHIANFTNLTDLTLGFCENLTDAGLSHLSGLTQLTTLDLSGCENLTDAGISHLSSLTQLTS